MGTPEQIADLVGRYERVGVDQVIFVCQAGKNRHEHIMESIELVGSQVIPASPSGARSAMRPSANGSVTRSSARSRGGRRRSPRRTTW